MSRLATAFCLTASVCLPQSPSTDPFLAGLDRIAQQQLDDRERAIAAIRTQADADRRKAMVRAKLTELIGGLPTYSGPLNTLRHVCGWFSFLPSLLRERKGCLFVTYEERCN